MGVYPFMFGSFQDFEPIAESIIKVRSLAIFYRKIIAKSAQKGLKEPYDWDEYAQMYFPKAEELVQRAEEAENAGEKEKASELYLYGLSLTRLLHVFLTTQRRASAVYRISRFPAPRSEKQRHAWEEGKKAARKGLG